MDYAGPSPDSERLVASGRRVVSIEATALDRLAESLDGSFGDATRAMLRARGRVIVSGMGKSGHVARKIAATLASTGTPALFIHPAEASHGDLGMIVAGDVVLLLSNSGETPELADLIAYTRRFAIPLIGVAANAESTLIRQADIGIVLPPANEACPMGLAPTSSTTMTLALGDAFAVALMEHRKFTPEDFRGFHPGGRLGARLATVENLMHEGNAIPITTPNTRMSEALLEMTQKGFGVVGVVDESGDLVGIITDGDLRRNMEGLLSKCAQDVMTTNPLTIPAGVLASEALGLMNNRKITTLFVTEREGSCRPVGILHVHDCLRAGVG